MATRSYSRALGAGETLIADVSGCAVPFSWTARAADWSGITVRYDGSISEEPENWIEPAQNGEITADVDDYELDPLRFMRFRHTAGGAVTITIACEGRVEFEVSS